MLRRTLLNKLTWAYLTLLTIVIGVVAFFTLNSAVYHLEQQIASEMLAYSELFELALTTSTSSRHQLIQEFKNATGSRLTIIAPDGTVLADTEEDPAKMENHLNRPEIQRAATYNFGQVTRFSTTTHIQTIYFAKTINSDPSQGFIRLAYPLRNVSLLKLEIGQRIFWIVLLTALLTSIIAYLFLRNLIKPLHDISTASQAIAAGDFTQKIAEEGALEIQELARSFNLMATNISQLLAKLTDERHQIEAILVSMDDGVVVSDARGYLILINPAAERIFQVHGAVVLGKHLLEVIRNYDLATSFEKTIKENSSSTHELRLFSPREMVISVNITPIRDAHGNAQGAVATIHDITTIRQLEQLRTEFVGNVSHELKTPLTAIRGFSETLLTEEVDQETARHFLEVISTESHRLSRLINDLLDLSQLESAHTQLTVGLISLPEIAKGVIELLKYQLHQKTVQVTLNFPAGFPLIQGDKDMLAQVFLNLLENAIKYTSPGGQIKITGTFKTNQIQIAVSDTGIGIPRQDLPRLFERFYRVDKARSRQQGGTGLGLAIVKHIIERHSGAVSVQSLLNQGTTFLIILPVSQPKEI